MAGFDFLVLEYIMTEVWSNTSDNIEQIQD